ncbi:hypothetical protein FRC17_000291 [Serendipita sp. 399]|nr:hypothetical protein FRC17_000291 [Serendipita sp. 399]
MTVYRCMTPDPATGSRYEPSTTSPTSQLSDDQYDFAVSPDAVNEHHLPVHISNAIYDMSALNGDYRSSLQKALDAGPKTTYHDELYRLLVELQKQQGVPQRPQSSRMEVFFDGIPLPQRVNGKGSKGGMAQHNCRWPTCNYAGTLQKCMDHFFSAHVKVKFFACQIATCDRIFTRKYDLDKHKKKIHGVDRPRGQGKRIPLQAITKASQKIVHTPKRKRTPHNLLEQNVNDEAERG